MEKEQIYIGEIGKHVMLKPMDKQEAIERIARAICKNDRTDTTGVCCDEICLVWKKYYLTKAEAVLNALLER